MEAAASPPPWRSEKLTYDLDGELSDLDVPGVEPFLCESDRNEEAQEAIQMALDAGLASGRLEIVEECGFHGKGPDTFRYYEWAIIPECPKDKAWFAERVRVTANPDTLVTVDPTPDQLREYATETRGLAGGWEAAADDAEDEGIADMYREDAADAERIAALLDAGKFQEALRQVAFLDTSPRESYEWATWWGAPEGARTNPRHYYPSKHPTPPGMPLHPTNTILVRLTKQGREEMDYSTLFAWLLYMFNRGYYRRLACGTCQQCIRIRDVKDIPVEGGRTLRNLATFKSGVDPDRLRPGDVLLQRVGSREGCGRPYIVVGTDPLETRGHGFKGGRAAGRNREDFDARQLERGTLVEMEHTASRAVAERIAMDHLVEHPDYYIELAKMEAMLRARRLAGNPWVGMNPGPAPEDWNYYINFVLYAVVGHMGPADNLMRQHGPGIRRVAEHLRQTQPWTPSKLYRGLLLDPALVKKGKVKRERDPARTFLSFSEKEDVACWFADPRSIVSGFVAHQKPGARSYLATSKGGAKARGRMLWTHAWQTLVLPGGRSLPLLAAANAHPEIDSGQFWWNMTTQSEVVLEPAASDSFKVKKLDLDDCPDVDELDATYAYPPFLDSYLRG
jgi:hypothetical protein